MLLFTASLPYERRGGQPVFDRTGPLPLHYPVLEVNPLKTFACFFASFLFLHGFGGIFRDHLGSRLAGVGAILVLLLVIVLLMIGLEIDAPRTRAGKAAAFGVIAAILLTCFGR